MQAEAIISYFRGCVSKLTEKSGGQLYCPRAVRVTPRSRRIFSRSDALSIVIAIKMRLYWRGNRIIQLLDLRREYSIVRTCAPANIDGKTTKTGKLAK